MQNRWSMRSSYFNPRKHITLSQYATWLWQCLNYCGNIVTRDNVMCLLGYQGKQNWYTLVLTAVLVFELQFCKKDISSWPLAQGSKLAAADFLCTLLLFCQGHSASEDSYCKQENTLYSNESYILESFTILILVNYCFKKLHIFKNNWILMDKLD